MNKKNDNRESNKPKKQKLIYDHIYDKETVNSRVLMTINSLTRQNKRVISPIDICIIIYNVDITSFYYERDFTGYPQYEINMLISDWLDENYYIEWLLCCAAIDDLLIKSILTYNSNGSLVVLKSSH